MKLKRIIVLGPTPNNDQKSRLKVLGEVKFLSSPKSSIDLVKATQGADVLYSDGAFLLKSLPKLKNIFVTYPYVELGVFNSNTLNKNGVIVANAQGGNRASIIEWVMYMVLSLFRKFRPLVRVSKNIEVKMRESLVDKKVLIIGKGSIGSKIAISCKAFGMKVDFFERGDDLYEKAKDADIIINALNCNSSSKNLLDEKFFMSLKKGSYFVTFVRPYTYDIDGLLKAIDNEVVAGAGIDCDPEDFGDTTNSFYQKCLGIEKVLVTPHIAFSTKQAITNGEEIAIRNIEAFIKGNPQNVLTKT